MEVQALEKVVDDLGLMVFAVDAIEDIACSLPRQHQDFKSLAVWGEIGYAGGDT